MKSHTTRAAILMTKTVVIYQLLKIISPVCSMKKSTPKVDFEKTTQQMKGKMVDRPNSANAGTLSGHAAGEPFEKCVLGVLREQYPKKILIVILILILIRLMNIRIIRSKNDAKLTATG